MPYHVFGYALLGSGSCSHEVGYSGNGVWYKPTGIVQIQTMDPWCVHSQFVIEEPLECNMLRFGYSRFRVGVGNACTSKVKESASEPLFWDLRPLRERWNSAGQVFRTGLWVGEGGCQEPRAAAIDLEIQLILASLKYSHRTYGSL